MCGGLQTNASVQCNSNNLANKTAAGTCITTTSGTVLCSAHHSVADGSGQRTPLALPTGATLELPSGATCGSSANAAYLPGTRATPPLGSGLGTPARTNPISGELIA